MNVADLVRAAADSRPEAPALVYGHRSLSYAELDDRIDLTAAALASLGVEKGDRVALLAGNIPEFASSLYGGMRAGAAMCPLNVTLTSEELAHILRDARARVAITEVRTLSALIDVRELVAELQTVLVIGGPPAPPGTVSLEEALAGEAQPAAVETDASDVALISYTSGTTAEPKGAMLTHGNILSNLDQMSAVAPLAALPTDVALIALPMFHIYALNAGLGMAMRGGASAVLVDRFDPQDTIRLIAEHRVSVIVGAPPMFSDWLAVAEEADPVPDFSSVRLAVSGASALPPRVLREFEERFGVIIWEGYGLTEAGPAVSTNALGGVAKPGSIGLPLPGVEVRLVDENGMDVEEDDDPGEIWVRGPNVFPGYWGRPDETADVLRGGWLHTGDIALRDEDDYLFIVDRKKDLIIVSGFNVFPKEVEDAIERHPKIAEAAVVGIADERTGEAIQAWVVPKEGESVTPAEILQFLQTHLARFKQPRDIQIVEELPHHVTGKVLRRMLRGQEVLGDVAGS